MQRLTRIDFCSQVDLGLLQEAYKQKKVPQL